MQTIYIEEAIREHPRVLRILERLQGSKHIINCHHYGEIFNSKSQNFRIQKQKPALILAKKTGRLVLPTPESFGIGGQENYYFSPMLNCLYDCRYCFLQGMYSSAHYVLFINYEDFMSEILHVAKSISESVYFFSGYNADSLVFEPVSHFLAEFIPFFRQVPNAILECRTKSANVNALLKQETISNCVVAFSFTPSNISKQIEYKVPAVSKRIPSMRKLAEHGWKIGLRFDPMIYAKTYRRDYSGLIENIFSELPVNAIHSVSIGPLRFPAKMYQRLVQLYPNEKILAHPLYKRDNYFSYRKEIEMEMKNFIKEKIKIYLDKTLIFECHPL